MIPKKIHYCWFGGNKKSKLILECIKSWKRYFPDFDTDVEVIKRFPEELRVHSFSGIEEFSKLVAPGLVYGCEARDIIVHEMVNEYEHTKFDNLRIEDIITINKRITRILDRYGYVHEDIYQDLGVLRVYPSEFFCAYDGKKRMTNITEKTLATHHYTASWLPWYRKIRLFCGTLLRRVIYRKG